MADGRWKIRMVVTVHDDARRHEVARLIREHLDARSLTGKSSVARAVESRPYELVLVLHLNEQYARDPLSASIWALGRLYDLWPGDPLPSSSVLTRCTYEPGENDDDAT